jgi:DNA-binding MarR family transcriptional regulator
MAGKTEELLAVWSEFFVGHALSIRAVEERMKGRAPLGVDEYDVLLCVSQSGGGRIRLSALADAALYTKSGITRILRRMEEQGFVRREVCPEDKRGQYAVLTDAGQRALRETWKLYAATVLELFEPLYTVQEAQQLRELLSRVVDSLRKPDIVQIRGVKALSERK